jgi:hypothetical protein
MLNVISDLGGGHDLGLHTAELADRIGRFLASDVNLSITTIDV